MNEDSKLWLKFGALIAAGMFCVFAFAIAGDKTDHEGLFVLIGFGIFVLMIGGASIYTLFGSLRKSRDERFPMIERAPSSKRDRRPQRSPLKIGLSKSPQQAEPMADYRSAIRPSAMEVTLQGQHVRMHTSNDVLHVEHRGPIKFARLQVPRKQVTAIEERGSDVVVSTKTEEHVVLTHEAADERAKAITLLQAWAANDLHEETEYERGAR